MDLQSEDVPTKDEADVLHTSKNFLDAAMFVDQLDKKQTSKRGSMLAVKESPAVDEVVEEAVEEEVVEDEVENAKKAFLQFAKEGATLVSKLEKKFTDYEEEVVEDDDEEIIEEVVEDEDSRAAFLAAAKAEFMNFSKGLNVKPSTDC